MKKFFKTNTWLWLGNYLYLMSIWNGGNYISGERYMIIWKNVSNRDREYYDLWTIRNFDWYTLEEISHEECIIEYDFASLGQKHMIICSDDVLEKINKMEWVDIIF